MIVKKKTKTWSLGTMIPLDEDVVGSRKTNCSAA